MNLLRKWQEWLGTLAVIDVSDIEARVIGIRHSHFNWRDADKPNVPCPKVHRSIDEWWGCTSAELAAWQADYIRKAYPLDGEGRRLAEREMRDGKAKADAMLAELR